VAHNAGRVVTQELLLQVNSNRLRRKIEDDHTHPRYLLTKVGVGYLLANPPGKAQTPPHARARSSQRRWRSS
jgi:DNA-binding response OmpR family regulator